MLGDGGEDVKRQPGGLRHVHRGELCAAVHQVRDERDVAREAVQARDEQHRATLAALTQGGVELRPVRITAAALNFGEFGDGCAFGTKKSGHGRPLSVAEVEKIADLESRDVLLAKLAGAMKANLSKAAALFNAPASQVARLAAALQEKKASEEAA